MPCLFRSTSPIYLLFTLSGLTSLVYEVLWLRGFAIVLGSTLYSFSCVLTSFMLGLAVGGAGAKRFLRNRCDRPPGTYVRWYGTLELVIALYGLALTSSLFLCQEPFLRLIARVSTDAMPARIALHFSFSFALLAIPTVCMGATLPVLCMCLPRNSDTSSLYGFNTLGAATGSLVASFFLIYRFGCLVSAFVVSAINVLIFAGSLLLARLPPAADAPPGADPRFAEPPRDGARPWRPSLVLALAFLSGVVFFSFELVWNRCLSLILGNRVYVTSITLFLVLACLAVGAHLSRRLVRAWGAESALFRAYSAAVIGTSLGVVIEPRVFLSAQSEPALALLLIGVQILLPATALAVLFPMLLSLHASRAERGGHVGRVYSANALGSVVGSLLTGYVLVDAFGSNRVLLLNAALLLLSLVLVAASAGSWRPLRTPSYGLALLAFAASTSWGWDRPLSVVRPEEAIVLDEDAYGLFSVRRTPDGCLSVRNNATELVYLYGRDETQFVQETQAHIPVLFAPALRRVLVIGSGYGITAGTFGEYPIDRVDAVEILPLMVKYETLFRERNYDYARNPRIRVHVADGRHFLAMAQDPYDVVSINVSDPYLPGSASLFSREFYAAVGRILSPGGVVCQHVFGPDLPTLYKGFRDHFPHVQAISSYDNGVSLIGARTPLALRGLHLLQLPRIREMLARIGIQGEAGVRALLDRGTTILAGLEAEPRQFINSDVFPTLEFRRSDKVHLLFSQH